MKLAVFHLVWGPLGLEMARGFANSYRATRSGADHALTVVYNGVGAERIPDFNAVFEGIADHHFVVPRPVYDLEAYRQVTLQADADICCFLNSKTRLRVDGWLNKLITPLDGDSSGMTGATGSWESLRFVRRVAWPLERQFAAQAAHTLLSIGRYPSAPNPHLRTNAFAARLPVLRGLDWPVCRTKEDTQRLESGRKSLSRQVLHAGRELQVVDAAGTAYPPQSWHRSQTFRRSDQSGLLIADNRTDEYRDADPVQARWLESRAWGGRTPR